MIISTYQHDYLPPNAKRYEFMNVKQTKEGAKYIECQCIETPKVQGPADSKDCHGVEWTGIAPMGRLVEPRLIPGELAQDQVESLAFEPEKDCFKIQPNRFLKILRSVYPDLYDRLKSMPKDELSRRLDRNRMFTTYQIDFCNVKEYPEGIYESLKPGGDGATAVPKHDNLLTRKMPCSEFRTNVLKELERETSTGYTVGKDECEKSYKPFKTTFEDSSNFVSSGDNSHWNASPNTFRKMPNFSEYMDSISRNGCVIMRNRLHDHSKCLANYCKHELKFQCNDMKP